jgi:predicted O-methyltransferase YrrM
MGSRPSATTLTSELWPDELAALLDLAKNSSQGGLYLEIGTAAGGTLYQMMNCFTDAARPRFVVVDTMNYFPDQLEIVRKNLRQYGLDPASVDFRISTGARAFPAAEATGETYDFMLIDGSHKIRHVTWDLRWLRLLKPGGVVCMHDYNDKHKGVKWPADRLLRKHPNYQREKLVGNLLVLRKTAPSATPEISSGDECWASLLAPLLQLELSVNKRLRRRRIQPADA